ncbi:MAG: cysteine desulfurase family protein [Erysipelotrichaceae bacterium]
MQDRIYLDNASSTSLNEEVATTYTQLLQVHYANSESLYDEGVKLNKLMNQSREAIASFLHVLPHEVLFTSGASESNNLAIKGLCFKHQDRKHIIVSAIEHSSIIETCEQLKRLFNYRITYLKVNPQGRINLQELKEAICADTLLVSIMWVNNEVGTIQDIQAIKSIVKAIPKLYLHVDGVQALGKFDLDLSQIDLASFSAHKIHGLKGSGILIKKFNVELEPLIIAGQQELGLRGGTSNAISNIVFAKTLRLALERQKSIQHIETLYTYLKTELQKIDGVQFNSPDEHCVAILNFSTPVKSEVMLNALNQQGIMVSALSTCHSAQTSSHVLKAMGFCHERITSSVRVSLDYSNTKEELDYFITKIKENIKKYG